MLPGRESPLQVSARHPDTGAANHHDGPEPSAALWVWLAGAAIGACGLITGALTLAAPLQWPAWVWVAIVLVGGLVFVGCAAALMHQARFAMVTAPDAGGPAAAAAEAARAASSPSPNTAGSLPLALIESLPGMALCLQALDQDWTVLAANTPAQRALDAAALPALPQRLSLLHKAWPDWSQARVEALGRRHLNASTADIAPPAPETEGFGHVRWLPWSDQVAVLWIQAAAQEPVSQRSVTEDDHEAMAYAVSHDLRAPIRVVEGFTRIVREDYGHVLDRIGNDHLERVLGAAARMNSMIDALLALSRLSTQDLQRQKVSLSDIALQVIDELRMPSPMRAVETRVAPDVVVQGDPVLLHCLMENLLANAWKYSARRELARIEFGSTERDGKPVYFVRDNGAGFDMRFADRLFGAFQRLHSASEFSGTGVGLASVQRVVRRHGGKVWAEAAVNAGATFYFTLQ